MQTLYQSKAHRTSATSGDNAAISPKFSNFANNGDKKNKIFALSKKRRNRRAQKQRLKVFWLVCFCCSKILVLCRGMCYIGCLEDSDFLPYKYIQIVETKRIGKAQNSNPISAFSNQRLWFFLLLYLYISILCSISEERAKTRGKFEKRMVCPTANK